jgi:transcription initiation factor IIE alpha subunit
MPYYRCTRCTLLSYSAANHSTVGTCPHCGAALAEEEEVETPSLLTATAQGPR